MASSVEGSLEEWLGGLACQARVEAQQLMRQFFRMANENKTILAEYIR